mmetsp:Transcript_73690/g.146536  ORF Transcript_73690/g.146536 Transcript_73690/m.146536 type:complete len:239 (+) Transcript_73690:1346-2062(+)
MVLRMMRSHQIDARSPKAEADEVASSPKANVPPNGCFDGVMGDGPKANAPQNGCFDGVKRMWRLMVGERKLQTQHGVSDTHARYLLRCLPWLPAYDRRDVLVVLRLLVNANLVPNPSLDTYHLLSLSAYVAAWQSQLLRKETEPTGDHVVDSDHSTLCLRRWLGDRNIRIAESTISFRDFDGSYRSRTLNRATARNEAEDEECEHCGLIWLDGNEQARQSTSVMTADNADPRAMVVAP